MKKRLFNKPYHRPVILRYDLDEEGCLAASSNTTEDLFVDADDDILGGDGSTTENWSNGGSYNW